MSELRPSDLQRVAVAIGLGGDRVGALEATESMIRQQAVGEIPDTPESRQAFTAWGIEFGPGRGISLLVSTSPTLEVKLPEGWKVVPGGNGHNGLLDARGVERLHWHIHAWDPVALHICQRFWIRLEQVSATEDVMQVLDGKTVIFTDIVTYTYARILDTRFEQHYWRSGWEEDGWSREQGMVNYRIKEDASELGHHWLLKNRPGYRDTLASWNM